MINLDALAGPLQGGARQCRARTSSLSDFRFVLLEKEMNARAVSFTSFYTTAHFFSKHHTTAHLGLPAT